MSDQPEEPWPITTKPGKLYLDHVEFLLAASTSGDDVHLRLFSTHADRPSIDFRLQLNEIPALIGLLQHCLAVDAENRLKGSPEKSSMVNMGAFPGFTGNPSLKIGSGG